MTRSLFTPFVLKTLGCLSAHQLLEVEQTLILNLPSHIAKSEYLCDREELCQ